MKFSDIVFALMRFGADGIAIFAGLTTAFYIRMNLYQVEYQEQVYNLFPGPETIISLTEFTEWSMPIVVVMWIIFALRREYRLHPEEKFASEITKLFWSLLAALSVVLAYFFFSQWFFFSRLIFAIAGFTILFNLVGARVILRIIKKIFYRLGGDKKKILLIGSGTILHQVISRLKTQPQCSIYGIITEEPRDQPEINGHKILGHLADFKKIINSEAIDEVWLASDQGTEDLTDNLVMQAHVHHKKFRFFPDELGMDLAAVHSTTYLGMPMLTLQNTKLIGWGLVLKTIVDLSLAVLALLLLWPIFLCLALLVWLSDPKAPIIYGSNRVGKNSSVFKCLKFRTMVVGADKQKSALEAKNERGEILFKIDNDPRVTHIGKWLRKFSLDELPQIFNVLKLEMSFIGPRPHLVEEVAQYPILDRQVLSIKPGISGYAQVNGRSSLTFRDEMRYEMFYLKNWSLWLDVVILIKSVWVVLIARNAS